MPNNTTQIVDERVVEMRIDNRQFIKGAEKSIQTLDKLDDALDFKTASRGLEEFSRKANHIDFSGIAQSVENIEKRFTSLGIAGMRTIERLTDTVLNYVKRVGKDLMFGQITAGWSKYEQVTDSMQTIIAATRKYIGEDFADEADQLAKVNHQLAILTRFTDETSYNLTDMTSNIGKFTSAGVHMENAAVEMQGIAVWAGLAGANTTQATNAMYNLSQAIAMGKLTLADWKSIETANMATLEMKEAFIDMAVNEGKLKRGADGVARTLKGTLVTATTFRESLSEGWLTNNVLEKTLVRVGDFADRISDISLTTDVSVTDLLDALEKYHEGELDFVEWQNYLRDEVGMGSMLPSIEALQYAIEILGDEEMAFGEKAFRASQETRTFSQALEAVKSKISSGWKDTFTYIFGDPAQQKELWGDVYDILERIFATSGVRRNNILKQWSEAGGRDDIIEGFKNIFEAISRITEPIKKAFQEVFNWNDIDAASKKLKSFTERFRDFTERLKISEDTADKLRSIFTKVFTVAKKGLGYVKTGGKAALKVLSDAKDVVVKIFSAFGPEGFKKEVLFDSLSDVFSNLVKYLGIAWQWIRKFGSSIKDVPLVGTVFDYLLSAIEGITSGFGDLLKNVDLFTDDAGELKSPLEIVLDIVDKIRKAFDGVAGDASEFGQSIKKIADFLGAVLEGIIGDPDEFKQKISDLFVNGFSGALEGLKRIRFSDLVDLTKTGIFAYIAVQFADFVKSIKKSVKNFGTVGEGFKGILTGVRGVLDSIGKSQKANQYIKMAVAIGILSLAMIAMSKALINMASIPDQKLASVAVTLGFLLLILAKIAKLIWESGGGFFSGNSSTKNKNSNNTSVKASIENSPINATLNILPALAANLIGIAVLVGVLTHAYLKLENMDPLKIINLSVILVATILLLLLEVNAISAAKDNKINWNSFFQMIALALVVAAVGSAFKKVASLSKEQILAAGFMIVIAIGVVALVIKAGENIQGGLGSIAIILSAMVGLYAIIAAVFIVFGLMKAFVKTTTDYEYFLKAISFIEIMVAAIGILMLVMGTVGNMKGALKGAALMLSIGASLVLFSVALAIAVPAILALMTGLLLIGKQLREIAADESLGSFWLRIAELAAIMLAVAAVAYVLGKAMMYMGVGLLAAGAGFALFGVGATLTAAAIGTLSLVLVPFGKALSEFCDIVADNGSRIVKLVTVVILAIVAAIVASKANIAWGLVSVILAVLNVLVEYGPEILTYVGKILGGILEFLYTAIPMVIKFLVLAVIFIINGVADTLRSNSTDLVNALQNLVSVIFQILIQLIWDTIGDIGVLIAGALEKGGFNSAADKVRQWGENRREEARWIGEEMHIAVGQTGEALKNEGATFPEMFAKTQEDGRKIVEDAFGMYTESAEETMDEVADTTSSGGEDAILEWFNGVQGSEGDVLSRMGIVGDDLASQFDMSDDSNTLGNNFLVGFGNGAWKAGPGISTVMTNIADKFVIDPFRGRLGIWSPSRVARDFGIFFDEGLILGITDKEESVADASGSVGFKMVETLKNAMALVAQIASDDMSISPVITPVVDMSAVDQSAASISGLFSTSSMAGRIGGIGSNMKDLENLSANMSALSEAKANNSMDTYEINVYATPGMDEDELADAVLDRISSLTVRKGVALG